MNRDPLVQMQNIRYSYGNLNALKGIDFDLYPGEIHALTGDHGSGKSSLVKLLSGYNTAQDGVIKIRGNLVTGLTPSLSHQYGIGMLYQNDEMITTGTLLDNIYIGRFPGIMSPGKKRALQKECRELFKQYGFDEDPLTKVSELTFSRRQVLSFMRVLGRGDDILILDEISQRTTPEQQEHIYRLLKMCRDKKKGIIYVTSNIDEIFQIADRVTILHNGHRRGTEDVNLVNRTRLMNLAFNFAVDKDDKKLPGNNKALLISRYDKRIINDIPQGLMIISPANEIQDINLAASRILESKPEEIKDTLLVDYIKKISLEKSDDIMAAITNRKSELWQKLKFGSKKLLKIRVSPLGEDRDIAQGTLLFLEDISIDYETKKYLQQAEKFVSTAEMAAGVAHEVNNPLSIIQNYLDLLQLENLSENSLDCVDKIQSELTRIVETISSLLSFSRVAVRPMMTLDINALLEEVVTLIGHRLQKRKITLKKYFKSKSLFLEGHENKLKQLFINLLYNATEAVLSGGEISIRTSQISVNKNESYIKIEIMDNGHGIPTDIQDHIFVPFYSTKMTKTNTGLGLSICQHIVESYNGDISVQSIPGKYTTFTIKLPLTQD